MFFCIIDNPFKRDLCLKFHHVGNFLAATALLAASAILPTFAYTSPTKGQNQINLKKMIKNIVLFHGAFVDGSCYAELIRHLQEAGINAVAVQKAPMKGLSPDANGEIILPFEAFADVCL